MARLRRSDLTGPGIRRQPAGKGFVYRDADGRKVTDPEVLDRIRALAIPPAWIDVWICPYPRGHIQAVGTDARGRRQYRYHDVWRLDRDREKFDHMLEFGRCLPKLRHCIFEHLREDGLGRDRVLACSARLLDLGFFRIGTEGYAEENQTYGLATIQKRHVKLAGDGVLEFDYVAKGGKRRLTSVVDPMVYDVVAALKQRRGGLPELLAWRRPVGRKVQWVDVKSTDINGYIKQVTGGDFTAKDFRTWNATVLAAVALAVSTEAASTYARKRAVTRAFQEVSHYLGNTPAVCRKSYVDPRVVDHYQAGSTVAPAIESQWTADDLDDLDTHGLVESALLDLLDPLIDVTSDLEAMSA
ncbi:MAG: topoisomerase [Actinomycetota bacterium]|jgi:DNA topoisomerase IB|nr:topoisomerase [Actinomycetota bacterium]